MTTTTYPSAPAPTGEPPLITPSVIYRSADQLADLVKLLLVATVVAHAALVAAAWRLPRIAEDVARLRTGARADFQDFEATFTGCRAAAMVLLVSTVVSLAAWLRRIRRNLDPLLAADIDYSSALAAGSWFIPFAQFALPWRIIRRCWKASDPEASPRRSAWAAVRVGPIVDLWGAVWLAQPIVLLAYGLARGASITRQGWTVGDFRAARADLVVSSGYMAVMFALTIAMVGAVTRRQRERAVRLARFGWIDPALVADR